MKYSLLLSLSAGMLLCSAAEKLPLPSGKAELKQKTSSRKAQNFIPEIKKQSIISGGKTLEINPNGQLSRENTRNQSERTTLSECRR